MSNDIPRLKGHMEKTLLTALIALAGLPAAFTQSLVTTLDDIAFWTGSGPNRSALVVEFNSSTTPFSLAWGYNWNESTSLQTMMFDLAGAITGGPSPVAGSDGRLDIVVSSFDGMGFFLDSLTYDQSGLGGTWPSGTLALTGWDGTSWNNLFTFNGTSSWSSGPFDLSNVGMNDTTLVDGGWYGWVLANGPDTYSFAQPVAAVPEPSAVLLLGAACTALLLLKKFPRRA